MKAHILIALSIIIFSCSKPSGDDDSGSGTGGTTVDVTPKIKSQTSSTDTIDYNYDVHGRAASEIFSLNKSKAVYIYSSGEIQKNFTNDGIPSVTYIFSLNSNGLVTKITNTLNAGNIINYTYNPDSTKSSETNIYPSYQLRFDYFYTNGNIDSIRHSDESGRWTNTTFMTYYLDQPLRLDYVNKGIVFFGKGTRNMPKSIRYDLSNSSYYQENYEYTYGQNGRVLSQKTTYITGGNVTRIYLANFTYY